MTKITMGTGREFIVADNYDRVKIYVKTDEWLEIEVTEYRTTSKHLVAVKHIAMITKLPHEKNTKQLTND